MRGPLLQEVEARRYRITAVLGKGGFGKVYRATMEGAGGFHKDVAIKLMRDEEVPELTLQRFRDEARILGLVRDRAIVNVDPPTRLAGRWAVVMEYVDGASVQRLMKLGPMPASVVVEVVQEVARALDKVYRLPGPRGEPLRLLHRDIKPANIQVTPDGEVKILDFGIAKADFSTREAHTQAYIGGTKGFIAPERLEGLDGPEADIFSLGVSAHYMLTGERPSRRQMMGLEEPDTQELPADAQQAMILANRMRAVDPKERPSARDVEETCARIRKGSDGATLRRWAEEHVPRAVALRTEDEMVGSILTETLAALPSEERLTGGHELVARTGDVPRASGGGGNGVAVLMFLGLLLAGILAGLGVSSFLLGGGLLIVGQSGTTTADGTEPERPALEIPAPVPVAAPPPGLPPAVAVPTPDAAPVPAADPAETAPEPPAVQPGTAPAPRPAPEPARPGPEPRPGPAPVSTAPAPRPAVEPEPPKPAQKALQKITFSSAPLGADVFVDGKFVGQTPAIDVALTEGRHEVKMVGSGDSIVRTIDVGRRNPIRYVWKGGQAWETHY